MQRLAIVALVAFLTVAVATSRAALTPDEVAYFEEALEEFLLGAEGQEFASGPMSVDVTITTVDVTTLGMGFCLPPDPDVDPDPNPTPPFNAWGCVNDVSVSASLIDTNQVAVIINVPSGFVDLVTSRPELSQCFECFLPADCGTVTRGAYVTTSATLSATYEEVVTPDGRELHPVPGSTAADLTDFSLVLEDACLEAYASVAGLFVALDETVEEAIETAGLPVVEIPAILPTESSTWGRVKALFTD